MSVNELIYQAKGRPQYIARRDRYYAAGRNAKGGPRKRPYQFLIGFTAAQRRERLRQQHHDWYVAHRKGKVRLSGRRKLSLATQSSHSLC